MTALEPITIRRAGASDRAALERLAALDAGRVPAGDVLVAEVDGQLRAALAVTTREHIADPFAATRDVVALLDRRAERLRAEALPKGDALNTAKVAGIMAAKRTPDLIPLCHGLNLTSVELEFSVERDGVGIVATARASDRTGVEMEALTAVSVAALTLYDMCKAVDKGMVIGGITLVEKTKEEAPA